ncbi:hypothetical protein [Ornithinimicrobium kibberense]
MGPTLGPSASVAQVRRRRARHIAPAHRTSGPGRPASRTAAGDPRTPCPG